MAGVLAVLSSVLIGTSDFLGGRATQRLNAFAVAGWSQVIGLVLLLVLLPFLRVRAEGGDWVLWSALAGISGGVGLVAFFAALATGTVGVVSALAALGAVVPVLVGVLAGERPSGLQALGIMLALAGAVAAAGPELHAGLKVGGPAPRSILLALLCAAGGGGMLVCLRNGAVDQPMLSVAGMRLIRIVAFGSLALRLRSVGGVRRADAPLLVGIAVTDVLGLLAYALAAGRGALSVVGLLGALFPVTTALLARFVLGERLSPVQGAGVGLAFSGVALVAG